MSVRLRGDSMNPQYQDGDVVFLRVGDVADARSLVGKDCMFERTDGAATFKRLSAVVRGKLILRALNRSKYPAPFVVSVRGLNRLAVAEAIRREIEPAHRKSGAPHKPLAATPASNDSGKAKLTTAA